MLSIAVYLCVYLSVLFFILGLAVKVVHYLKNPLHLRWELYPVAHEANKAEYGGSYLEETDWANKPRHKSLIGELRVMIPEIFLLKAVRESNRSLWFVSLPFHLGLYCTTGFVFVLFINALTAAAGFSGILPEQAWINILKYLGLCGFILTIVGALGLIYRRIANENLRNYSSVAHYFNLGWFIVVIGLFLRVWFVEGQPIAGLQNFALNLVSFDIHQPVHSPIIVPVILGAVLVAYIPWTHMAHFFMKYFLYHDIRWGDEPMLGATKDENRLQGALNYIPTWAAGHVHANGKRTWTDLALQNPAQEQSKE